MLEEESYYTSVNYDAMYDDIYFHSRYRFGTKELVEQFINQVETKYSNVIVSCIEYEKKRCLTGYTEEEPYRPRFSNVENAMVDLEQMVKYCNNYYLDVDKSTYKYHGNISTEPLKEYELMFLTNKNKKLIKENKEIKENFPEHIEKTNYSIEELNKIIEKCQNKINELIK
jgi:hypothetical protein